MVRWMANGFTTTKMVVSIGSEIQRWSGSYLGKIKKGQPKPPFLFTYLC